MCMGKICGRKMHILVDNGSYDFRNVGDAAMLQALVARFRALVPGARFTALTSNPDKLAAQCPGVAPLSTQGRRVWLQQRNILGPLFRLFACAESALAACEDFLRVNGSRFSAGVISARMARRGIETDTMRAFLEAIDAADAVVASGGGYLTDVFAVHAAATLHTLRLAQQRRKPTAFFGQGIGPLDNVSLRKTARQVFRRADLIALRERRRGVDLLQRLGVPGERLLVTGDDAIELAHAERPDALGTGLGVNVRLTSYSDIDPEQLAKTGRVIKEFAARRGAALHALPISFYEGQDDLASIRALLGSDMPLDAACTDTPQSIIRQAGKCRVALTGSYHAGVFALSQGIPVVALARSPYYTDKFLGLMEAFGAGCVVVFLDDPALEMRLMENLNQAWESADDARAPLLIAAERQIAAGRAAYARFVQETLAHA